MSYMFDHTTIVAKDDPELAFFQIMDKKGLIQLRILDTLDVKNLPNMSSTTLTQ